jgi:hypothetical protein
MRAHRHGDPLLLVATVVTPRVPKKIVASGTTEAAVAAAAEATGRMAEVAVTAAHRLSTAGELVPDSSWHGTRRLPVAYRVPATLAAGLPVVLACSPGGWIAGRLRSLAASAP